MLYLGCHLSSADGFAAMGRTAKEIGANTFQFFTRNPRGGRAKELDPADAAALREMQERGELGRLVAHAPYTINPCSADPRVREFAVSTMADDLRRLESLPNNLYNFHPGSHVGQGAQAGISLICEALDVVLREDQHTTVLLETMAGKGSEVGGRFEELRAILDGVALSQKLGVCLDTCHVNDAGYDVARDLDGVLAEFDRVIGLSKLRAIHLNDSKNPLGACKDRHEKIGLGFLGEDAIVRVAERAEMLGIPAVLETPCDLAGYAEEIARIRRKIKENSASLS